MPRSMTGFGRATREGAAWQMTVEVKSVNHRFLKTQFRLAEAIESAEPDFENRVRAKVARGAVTIVIDVKRREGAQALALDAVAAKAQLDRLRASWACLFPDAAPPEPARLFEMLLRLPQAAADDDDGRTAELVAVAGGALDEALAALEGNRAAEGAECAKALSRHQQRVAELLAGIAARAPVAIRAAQTRFVERVNLLLHEAKPGLLLDPEAVLREAALFADKGDISEEINRLGGHIGRFDEVLRQGQESGRRLDFLLQEMLREANTIGSKSLDLAISHDVVEVKAEIEKMKEQVQNLE